MLVIHWPLLIHGFLICVRTTYSAAFAV
uniref:Uncharacterized protein n=1 Tax=Arundo donax TaxID=35708 RepID=A0A0A8ZTF9_ARUDO